MLFLCSWFVTQVFACTVVYLHNHTTFMFSYITIHSLWILLLFGKIGSLSFPVFHIFNLHHIVYFYSFQQYLILLYFSSTFSFLYHFPAIFSAFQSLGIAKVPIESKRAYNCSGSLYNSIQHIKHIHTIRGTTAIYTRIFKESSLYTYRT